MPSIFPVSSQINIDEEIKRQKALDLKIRRMTNKESDKSEKTDESPLLQVMGELNESILNSEIQKRTIPLIIRKKFVKSKIQTNPEQKLLVDDNVSKTNDNFNEVLPESTIKILNFKTYPEISEPGIDPVSSTSSKNILKTTNEEIHLEKFELKQSTVEFQNNSYKKPFMEIAEPFTFQEGTKTNVKMCRRDPESMPLTIKNKTNETSSHPAITIRGI